MHISKYNKQAMKDVNMLCPFNDEAIFEYPQFTRYPFLEFRVVT